MNELEIARRAIRDNAVALEELGLGDQPLSPDDLAEIESRAKVLLGAIAEYRRLSDNGS